MEISSVWSRLGSDVTVVEFMDDIAAGADKEVAKNFLRILKKQGMKFEMRQKVTKAIVNGDGVDVTIEQRDGGAVRTERFEKVRERRERKKKERNGAERGTLGVGEHRPPSLHRRSGPGKGRSEAGRKGPSAGGRPGEKLPCLFPAAPTAVSCSFAPMSPEFTQSAMLFEDPCW